MSDEVFSIAIYEPLPGMEEKSQATIRELMGILSKGGYSRDHLYHSAPSQYILLRHWTSEDARRNAQEDPEAQRCWARLAHEIKIVKIYETLEEVQWQHL
jgi:heme-degrading monooxygenase HmoA